MPVFRWSLPLLALLTGCGDTTVGTADEPEQARHVLEVVQSFEAGRNGLMYMEGGLADVVLRDADGRELVQQGDPDAPLRFVDLPAGRYVLAPATRPCNANCGNLDERTDECETIVEIPAITSVRVRYVVGHPCETTPVGLSRRRAGTPR